MESLETAEVTAGGDDGGGEEPSRQLSPLEAAVAGGDLEKVKLLADEGHVSDKASLALHWAALKGHCEIAR